MYLVTVAWVLATLIETHRAGGISGNFDLPPYQAGTHLISPFSLVSVTLHPPAALLTTAGAFEQLYFFSDAASSAQPSSRPSLRDKVD